MGVERISLVSDETKKELSLESRIKLGEINQETFKKLPEDEQKKVQSLLFKMALEKIEVSKGLSSLEFILFGFMRITNKKVAGMSLSQDEKEIEIALKKIMSMHEITNPQIAKENWLFDYFGYAEKKSLEFLQNRKEHVDRKKQITGDAK